MEEIARRRPIDRTAARVTAAGPKGLESSKRITQMHSETPIPLRAVPKGTRDHTGCTFGTLTVMGLAAMKKGANGLRWSCRCVCGCYVTRLAKAIWNKKNAGDCCDRCRQVKFLRRRSEYQQLGWNTDERQ